MMTSEWKEDKVCNQSCGAREEDLSLRRPLFGGADTMKNERGLS